MMITRKASIYPVIFTAAAALQLMVPATAEAAVSSTASEERTSIGICHLIDFDDATAAANGLSKRMLRQLRRSSNFDDLLSYSLDHCPEMAAILLGGATGSVGSDGENKARDDNEEQSRKKPSDEKPGDEKPSDEKPSDEKPGDEEPDDDKPTDEGPDDDEPRKDKPTEDDDYDDDEPINNRPWDEDGYDNE